MLILIKTVAPKLRQNRETVLPVDYDGLSEQVIWLGTCSHAHGTVGDEGIPLGLSFDKNFLGWLCLLIYPSVMILGIWKIWTQTKLSLQVEANQVIF